MARRRNALPLGSRSDIEVAWAGVEPAPSVMAVPGTAFDMWRIAAVVGAAGLRELEHQRLAIWPPTVRTPDGRCPRTPLQSADMVLAALVIAAGRLT
jgi:hypothetical protein